MFFTLSYIWFAFIFQTGLYWFVSFSYYHFLNVIVLQWYYFQCLQCCLGFEIEIFWFWRILWFFLWLFRDCVWFLNFPVFWENLCLNFSDFPRLEKFYAEPRLTVKEPSRTVEEPSRTVEELSQNRRGTVEDRRGPSRNLRGTVEDRRGSVGER